MFDRQKKGKPVADTAQGGNELTLEQAGPMTRSMVAQLGYPCRIFSAKASYEEVMDAYEQAVSQGQQEGFTPVLVPADETLDEFFGILRDDGYSLEETLKAEPVSGEEWLKKRLAEFPDELDMEFDEEYDEEYDDEYDDEYGDGSGAVDQYMAFQGGPGGIKETMLLKVPTTRPWEVVAYVPFGGWNECPEVGEMMAVCRYWFEKYGAVPVTISHDVMEMRVPEPVAEQDSMQAAREHFVFCPDIVDQGTGTLGVLAKCIAASKIWFFWWD